MNKQRMNGVVTTLGMGCLLSTTLYADKMKEPLTVPPKYEWGDQAHLPPPEYKFPVPSYKLPYDIGSLKKNGTKIDGDPGNELAQLQKQFDMFSWATFIALNWPADNDGKPLQNVEIGTCNSATRVWEHYIAPQDFFKPNGEAPDPWGQPQHELKDLPHITKDPHILNEIDEAFFNLETPMPSVTDLNNEYVRYEVRFNKPEYDYMLPFHTQEKQLEYINQGKTFEFPMGRAAKDGESGKMGAMELKVAWKKMGPSDDPSRFYTITASYENPTPDGVIRGHGLYGMVGMHIAVRTKSAPQWVWATFEHVDNSPRVTLPFEKGAKMQVDGDGKKYSFWNKNGKDSITGFDQEVYEKLVELSKERGTKKAASSDYYQKKSERDPSQIAQVITSNNDVIASTWTTTLNGVMQKQLAGTVWENYRLVSTQWPSEPKAPTPTGYKVSLGVPAPVSLGNPVMETYLQVNGSCMACHAGATTNVKASQKQIPTNFSFMLQRATTQKK